MKLSWKRQCDLKLFSVSVTKYKYSLVFRKGNKSVRIVQISTNNYYCYVCDNEIDFISHYSRSTISSCLEYVSYFFNCT